MADEASYRKKLEVTRSYLHPEAEVLEFGCGSGQTSIWHAPKVRHIRAIDSSLKMVEIARENVARAEVDNVTVEQSTWTIGVNTDRPELGCEWLVRAGALEFSDGKDVDNARLICLP